MENAKYWAFICHHQADVGTYGGAWHKKTHELRKFETEEELDKFIESVPEMADYDSSIEIIRTSNDDEEDEDIPEERSDLDEFEDEYEANQ